MHQTPMESLLADQEMMDEIRSMRAAGESFPRAGRIDGGDAAVYEYLAESTSPASQRPGSAGTPVDTEAIVLSTGRPSLLIRNGLYDKPASEVWRRRLVPLEAEIERIIPSVGRVELVGHFDYDWVGTAWVVAENVLLTNRHVADVFAERQGQQFVFRRNFWGQDIQARIDFREEYQQPTAFEIRVEEVIYIAPSGRLHPDLAVLRLRGGEGLPDPIPLAQHDAVERDLIGVVGYPARDSRNVGAVMSRIFNDIFDVKRFAPGFVTYIDTTDPILEHDCTTLGGNSGSVVFNLQTGDAVGLHFAGRFGIGNYAVKASVVQQTLSRLGARVMVNGAQLEDDERARPEDYADRAGYQEQFLGPEIALKVTLPELSATLESDAVRVTEARGMAAYALDYTHFSVVMSKSRKLAFYTAVNIDGNQEVSVRRRGTRWKIDPRIDRSFQIGNELYRRNHLDRGHLVRRLDPVWGSTEVARQANSDTFHYTNASPQHANLNQRTWLQLEDFILDATNNRDLKISVFTGPVFDPCDPVYRDVKIPQAFWKVVAMVNPAGDLHATAYQLSQSQFMDDLEFVFGQFRTHQMPIASLEALTGISFGRLSQFDPMGQIEGIGLQRIEGPEDLIL